MFAHCATAYKLQQRNKRSLRNDYQGGVRIIIFLSEKNRIMRVLKSFLFALRGLKDCFLHEKNLQIQFVISLLVVGAGFFLSISATEWIFILLCCAVVLSLEIVNSAIEKLCDLVCPT